MMIPGLRLADFMILVLVAALGSAAFRAVADYELLIVGALPMANILAVAWLSGRRCRGGRRFLLGGLAALVAYVVLATCFPEVTVLPYADLCLDPLRKVLGYEPVFAPIILTVAVAVLTLPQLVIALCGDFLYRLVRPLLAPDPPGTTP